jgi:ATP-dependent DNA helicase RecG
MPYSDEELESLLQDLESDRVERKESWRGDAPEKGRQAACAFANDLPNHSQSGILFVGVNDAGVPTGLPITDELLRTLADIKTDGKIVPPPTLTVEKRHLCGQDIAVVVVEPADSPPVRYEGRIWIRLGPRRGLASAQDERILSEKRRHRDIPFDIQPLPSCPLGELNRIVFEQQYLPRAVASDILEANDRTYEQKLASTSMVHSVDAPQPTVTGVLTLAKSPRSWIPGAYIEFLRIAGTEWGDPVSDEQEIDGTLDTMLNRLDDKLKAHNSSSVEFTSGTSRENRTSPYPISALQQISRNAVLHRTYEGTHAPIRIYWFDNRIEVLSPGGPYGMVNAENFGQPGRTDYRNPNIASVLKNLGFVQRFGFGIAEARKALDQNGNPPPEFQVESSAVLVILRPTSL